MTIRVAYHETEWKNVEKSKEGALLGRGGCMTAFSNDDVRELQEKDPRLEPRSSHEKDYLVSTQGGDSLVASFIQRFPLPIAWKNSDHRYVGANHLFASLLGIGSLQEILGKSDRDLPWSDAARLSITRLSEEVFAVRSPRSGVLTIQTESSQVPRTFRIEASPLSTLKDGREEFGGCSFVLIDISTEVASEQARRASETRFRAMLERVPVVVWTIDRDLKVIPHASHGIPSLFGRPLTGDPVSLPQFFQTQDPNFPPVLGARRALAGESVRFLMPWQGFEYEVFIEPIRDHASQITGAIGITIDITDQRRQAEALRHSEERYRSLAEFCPIGIWQTDLDGKTTYMNPAMCELLQLQCRSEAIQGSYRNFFSPASRNKVHEKLADAGRLTRFEAEVIGKQGRSRTVLVTSVPVFGPDERIIGQLHTYLDITEQKRNEEERRRVETRIRHSQKVESLGLLAEGIAHDFNNLLLGVLGNAGLATLEIPPNSRAAFRLEQVKRAAEQAADLTNQLFLYSGSQRAESQRQVIHLSSEVEEICRLLETALEKKARLKFDLSINLPAIEADTTQIRQVIMNLVTNAREAIRGDSGQITIRTGVVENLPLDIQEDFSRSALDVNVPRTPFVFLDVQDSGCGMDKDTRARMFDPFFSTKPLTASEDHEGCSTRGFGLASVLGAVRSHKGAIHVQSSPERGTNIRIYLPVRPGLSVPLKSSSHIITKQLSKNGHGVVLVVDDDPIVQEVAQVALEKFGYHVVVAKDGRQALVELDHLRDQDVLLRKGLPKEGVIAILLDLTMPVLDGEGVLKQLEVRYPQMPVILSSGYSKEGVWDRIRHTGKLKFLQKPYRPTVLIETLQGMV